MLAHEQSRSARFAYRAAQHNAMCIAATVIGVVWYISEYLV